MEINDTTAYRLGYNYDTAMCLVRRFTIVPLSRYAAWCRKYILAAAIATKSNKRVIRIGASAAKKIVPLIQA